MKLPAIFARKPKAPEPPRQLAYTSAALVAELNAVRRKAGCLEVIAVPPLNRAAVAHAATMAIHGKVSHRIPGEDTGDKRALDHGYKGRSVHWFHGSGTSASEAIGQWSALDRDGLLADSADAGSGVAKGADGRWYWCLILGRGKRPKWQ